MAKQELYLDKITALVAKYGAATFTTASLARRLAVSPKTIYNNFGSYPELLVAMADYNFAKMREELLGLASSPSQNAVVISLAALGRLTAPSDLLTKIFLETLRETYSEVYQIIIQKHERLVKEFFALNIPRGRSETLYRVDFDTDLIASVSHATILELSQTQNPAEKRDQVATFIIQGIATPLGSRELYTILKN